MQSEMVPPERVGSSHLAPDLAPARRDDNSNHLGERLDTAIGETSSGIGALLSELVRRSLKTGVSEIGESLIDFARERVEIAVERQMPLVAEAADAVAESTSKRVIQSAVDELKEESAKQKQELESEIHATESRVLDQSILHIEEAVSEVRQSIDQTRHLAVEGVDSSERKIEELREKARQSWKKFVDQFATINDAHAKLQVDHEALRSEHETLRRDHEDLVMRVATLDESEKLLQSRCESLAEQLHQTQTTMAAAETKFAAWRGEVEARDARWATSTLRLEERLAVLEQPRGLKRLLSKFQRHRPADVAANEESTGENEASD